MSRTAALVNHFSAQNTTTERPALGCVADHSNLPTYYPVSLDLRGRSVVVIGGSAAGEGKARDLVRAGAVVTVIARTPSPRLETLARSGAITLVQREYREGDLSDAFLAIAALESPAERTQHAAIWREANNRRVLLNALDDAEHCHFIAPAIHRQGAVTVAVSTSGASPALAVQLRNRIARIVGPEYADFAALLASLRPRVAREIPNARLRTKAWERVVRSDARFLLRRVGYGAARDRVEQLLREPAAEHPRRSAPGTVYIVGGGPGAPGLLTLHGLAALRRADAVVYDRLIDPALLGAAPKRARRIYAGKPVGASRGRQAAINRILVRLARRGCRVVRLKGGDPFVFGRGGEECLALRAAGVPFKVIPGVSAAIAAPAAAGIPVTQRGVAAGFVVLSARGTDGSAASADWDAVARIPTVVVLMGVDALEETVAALVRGGKAAETPAALVCNATLPNEHTVVASLATIVDATRAAGIRAPATLIVGNVVALHGARR